MVSLANNLNQNWQALLYSRVSDTSQKTKGSGLGSQEYRCRQYAEENGWPVAAAFEDDVTGGGDFMKRKGMAKLLGYLDAHVDRNYVVIFDDLKRFARDTEFHRKLRRILTEKGAVVRCLNFTFEDTPEGEFIETIFAAHGELERKQNRRQVDQKMRARVEQGFWVTKAPMGYHYVEVKRGGKELRRTEPLASVLQEALEGFACGRYDTQCEVQRFLEGIPEFPHCLPGGKIRAMKITRLLTNPIYAGYVHSKVWNISLRQGQHEGLISYETFRKIQSRLEAGAMAPARKDINLDFPLRGFVTCADCDAPLRSCWSKGKFKKYPYYLCHTKTCDSYGKSIPKAKVEGDFEKIVKSLCPSENVFNMAKAMFENALKQRLAQATHSRKTLRADMLRIEKQIEAFAERIIESASDAAINAYERKIDKLENERLLAEEKLAKGPQLKATKPELIELSLRFLANPWKLWASGNIALQKTVLRLAFSERLSYHRKDGYRTPKTTLPFKVLEDFRMGECKMVPHG